MQLGMTKSHEKSVANPSAAQLASELGGYEDSVGIPDDLKHTLTPLQNALISDTFGLLNGIGFGTITVAQPRIQQNLIRVISELSETKDATKVQLDFMNTLSTILSRAGTAGLTAERQPLSTHVSLRSR